MIRIILRGGLLVVGAVFVVLLTLTALIGAIR